MSGMQLRKHFGSLLRDEGAWRKGRSNRERSRELEWCVKALLSDLPFYTCNYFIFNSVTELDNWQKCVCVSC